MKHSYQSAICLLTLITLALPGMMPANLRAAAITVTSTGDNGAGTLRSALASAANGDTINFSLPQPATITLTSGELPITKNVSITGPGASHLAIDGNAASIVFHIVGSNSVLIAGLTITNGRGISSEGATLTVSNSIIIGNSYGFYGSGGGIYSYVSSGSTTLTIVNSTVSGNSASFGGGICMLSQGGNATLNILNSTVSSNSATFAGGIWSVAQGSGSTVIATIVNSTVSGNSADEFAGGIWNEAEFGGSSVNLQIVNSTLSGNSASVAHGGIWNYCDFGGSANLKMVNSTLNCTGSGIDSYNDGTGISIVEIGGTILNANSAVATLNNDSGTVTSLGYNLSSDGGGGFLTNVTDQINTDPMLGPLQDNGGPTFTHAPASNSPAIDQGINFSTAATDQRDTGFARTSEDPSAMNAIGGDGTDIGAFEVQQPIPIIDNPPVADASATVRLVISPKHNSASVILDGSRSSDPDGDLLQYTWTESGSPLASGVVAVTILPVGTHLIQLVVSDGTLSDTNAITIEVITATGAVTRLAARLNSNVPHRQPLVASLRAALASIDRCNPVSAINQLQAFQNKVRAQVGPLDHALATSLIHTAQDIIDSLTSDITNQACHPHGKFTSFSKRSNGHVQLQFSTEVPGTYILEASTDLISWKMIGVATPLENGQFQFEDVQCTNFSSRFYRIAHP